MAKTRIVPAERRKPPCIFCGAPANSKEHLWQRWLMKRMRQIVGPTGRIEGIERERAIRPRTSLQLGGMVCEQTCNNGWMRQLENDTIPIASPMLEGNDSQLQTPQQLTLSTWTMLRAVCFDCKAPPRFFDARETGHLRAHGTPPHSTFGVWLGYSTSPVAFSEGQAVTGKKTDGSIAEGYVLTCAFGHLIIQSLTIRSSYTNPFVSFTVSTAGGPWDEALVRIWPLPYSVVSWPPKLGFDPYAGGLDVLAQRFNPGRWSWKGQTGG